MYNCTCMTLDVAVMAQFSSRDINVGDENVADRYFSVCFILLSRKFINKLESIDPSNASVRYQIIAIALNKVSTKCSQPFSYQ